MSIIKRITAVISAIVIMINIFPVIGTAAKDKGKTFKCAWFNETLTYPYEYSDELFDCDPYTYNHNLATFSLCVAMASFNSFDKTKGDEHIRAMLEDCGFEVNSYGYDTEGYDTAGVAIASKKIGDADVIIAAIRSGNYGMEWGGNLRVGESGDHEGFSIGTRIIIGYLNTYFKEHPCADNVKLLIPGYSRGASIANLTAADLDDGTYAERLCGEKDYIGPADIDYIYTYTFEAPQCTISEDVDKDIYKNIFNIVNPNDYVPMFVMDEWGCSLYGNRIEMPCADNCDNYDEYYNRVCKEFDSYMGVNDRKAKNCFYSAENSKSTETTFNYIFAKLGTDVMLDRENFSKTYEPCMVFFAGQYLGKKRTFKDFAHTVGVIISASVNRFSKENKEKIAKDGYVKYLSCYIAEKNGGELDSRTVENTYYLVKKLLVFIKENRNEVKFISSQLHTAAEVHQPYIALAWMRALNQDDVEKLNRMDTLKLSCSALKLKYDVNGRIAARCNVDNATVKWTTSDKNIVTVADDGFFYCTGKGNAMIYATLFSEKGEKLETKSVSVTVDADAVQSVSLYFKSRA